MNGKLRHFTKIAAGAAAVVMALSLGGCMDNGTIMTVDGMKIRNGVYLTFMQTAMQTASQRIEEIHAEEAESNSDTSSDTSSSSSSDATSTESSSEEADIFTESLDGMSFSDWVKQNTRKGVLRFVGTQRLCDEYGITLTEEEKAAINSSVQESWDEEDAYLQYLYGMSTMGDYYRAMGIEVESLKQIAIVNELNTRLFDYFYGEGGEHEVPQEEIDKYIKDNFAAYRLISVRKLDYKGDVLFLDDELKELKDRAQSYADRLNDGEAYVDVLYDFDLLEAQNSAKADAEESYTEDNADGLTKEEYIQKAVDAASADKGESDDDYDEVISKSQSVLTEELTDYIFGLPADGKATVYEGAEAYYVVVKLDIMNIGWVDANEDEVLHEMREDDFDSLMDLMCQNYDVKQNDYLVNTKYSPEKMR